MKSFSKYVGCLVGGVIGDCMGSPYENSRVVSLNRLVKDFSKIQKGNGPLMMYTDDTAMARSLAQSLISEHKAQDTREVHQENLARRFTEEYFKDPNRGYGYNIGNVFSSLLQEKYADPTGPASRQFDGSGSHGNGSAMRVAPAALYGETLSNQPFNKLIRDTCTVTHYHINAINGSILLATAIHHVLKLNPADKLSRDSFLHSLHIELEKVEESDRNGASPPEMPYCLKLEKMKELLSGDTSTKDVVESLGNDVSALGSVPAAIYVFLRAQDPIDGIETDNVFERVVIYSISLGGDTDTIASMAGALTGAYYGIDGIEYTWQAVCEGVEDAKQFAEQLFYINYGKDE